MSYSGLNKVCELRDFSDEVRVNAIRELEPEYSQVWPNYPAGREHRKSWEYAQVLAGVDALSAVNRDSLVLAVGTGVDKAAFALTRRARIVFVAGVYAGSAAATMLTQPETFASCQLDRNRLVVQHMRPPDLRYEDETFDFVYALGIGGGLSTAAPMLRSMTRVCRTGGIVMMTVECAVEGEPPAGGPLSRDEFHALLSTQPSLQLLEPVDWRTSVDHVRHLDQVMADLGRGYTEFPHLVLEQHGCRFTSLSAFVRKTGAHA